MEVKIERELLHQEHLQSTSCKVSQPVYAEHSNLVSVSVSVSNINMARTSNFNLFPAQNQQFHWLRWVVHFTILYLLSSCETTPGSGVLCCTPGQKHV